MEYDTLPRRVGEGYLEASWKGAIEQGNKANTHLSVTLKVPSELSDVSLGLTAYNEQ
jgi:hypothetical protein